MSRDNVELVRTLQPAEADLVEMFAGAEAPTLGATPAELSGFADGFQVEFVSSTAEAERPS